MLAIKLPETERGVGPSALARFEKAERALANPMTKPRAREEHARAMARIEAAPKEAADKAWQDQALIETMDLAEARGEEVENPAKGVVRIRSRDGFHNLYVNRQLTQEEYDQGSEWRKCFEARSGDVGSQTGAESGGGGHDNNRFVGNRFLRAFKTNLLAIAQRRIAMECIKEPAALQMFNEIVGNSKCLTSFGRGRAYDRHLGALKLALTWAEVARKEEAQKRGMAA